MTKQQMLDVAEQYATSVPGFDALSIRQRKNDLIKIINESFEHMEAHKAHQARRVATPPTPIVIEADGSATFQNATVSEAPTPFQDRDATSRALRQLLWMIAIVILLVLLITL